MHHHEPSMAGALIFMVVMTTWLTLTAVAAYRHNKAFDASESE